MTYRGGGCMLISALHQNIIFLLNQTLACSPYSKADQLFSLPGELATPNITPEQHFKAVTILLKIFISACLILTLSACGGGDGTETTTETTTEPTSETTTETPVEVTNETTTDVVIEIPEFIQSISAQLTAGGELKASISIDGGTPNPMIIDLINNTSSATIELSKEKHSITITFTYTDANNTKTVILATATKEVDLSNNNDVINFENSDYDIEGHDDDNDGFSNLA